MSKTEPDSDTAQLEAQIIQLRADLARVGETLAAIVQSGGETLRATLAEKGEAVRAQGEAGLADAAHLAEAKLDDVTVYARKNPVQAMAIAGGLGLLLGLLFGRR